MPSLFENENIKKRQKDKEHAAEVDSLYKQIGKLTAQIEWAKKKIWQRNFAATNGSDW
jgi:hypothetical protein